MSVAGAAVEGDEDAAPRTLCKYAHNSYTQVSCGCVCRGVHAPLQVCGKGHRVRGDAVVPVESALLEVRGCICWDGFTWDGFTLPCTGFGARVAAGRVSQHEPCGYVQRGE